MDVSPIVLIPARSGSQRFPDKNLSCILGRRLIDLATDWCEAEGLRKNKVFLYTDYPTSVGTKNSVYIKRPGQTATNSASADDVLNAFVTLPEVSRCHASHLLFLQPTSPLRPTGLLNSLKTVLHASGAEIIATGTAFYEDLWAPTSEYMCERVFNEPRLQQLRMKRYVENGLAYLIDLRSFYRTRKLAELRWAFLETAPETSIDINTEWDYQCCSLAAHSRCTGDEFSWLWKSQ